MHASADDETRDAFLDVPSSSICNEFEHGLRSGIERPIEDLLKDTRISDRSTLLSRLVMIELHHRILHGERPELDEYYRRFPRDVDVLRPLGRFLDRIIAELELASAETRIASEPIRHVREFAILREIGSGGFGIVWEARDETLKRRVAIKQIDRSQVGKHEFDMAKREAQIAAQLNHPNIVQTFGYFEEDDGLYLVTEYVAGSDLKSILYEHGPLDASKAVDYTRQIAEALAYAHEHDVIHRDVKPSNILIDTRGNAKLCDFGVAHWQRAEHTLSMNDRENLIGTAGYMSPEQAEGRDATDTSDVYSLGLVFYEMLTGKPPFKGKPRDLLVAHQIRTIPSPRLERKSLHRDLETICQKAVEKKRSLRYLSATAMANDLRLHAADQPIIARPISRLQRAWRAIRRRPASSTTVAISLIFCCAAAPLVISPPLAEGTVNVTITTEPEGADILVFSINPVTGLRDENVPLHGPSDSPTTLPLKPGDYWVQATRDGILTEFVRHVPEDINQLTRLCNFESWERAGDHAIKWPPATLRETPALHDMVFIPGASDFPVRRWRDADGNERVMRRQITPFYISTHEFTIADYIQQLGRFPMHHDKETDGPETAVSARYDRAMQWSENQGARLPTEFEFDYLCTLQAMHEAGNYEEIDRIVHLLPMTRTELTANLEKIKNLRNGAAEWVIGEKELYPDSVPFAVEPEFPELEQHWKVLKGGHAFFDPDRPEDFADVELGYRYMQRHFVFAPAGGFRMLCPALKFDGSAE